MGLFLFNPISLVSMLSPPFLLLFAWIRFLNPRETQSQPRWRTILAWAAILAVSSLMAVCIVAFLTIPCNVDLGDWSGVARWRSFTRFVIQCSLFVILLALFGRKGTRIPTALAVVAIDFDCLLVDMMA
jgi:hypothetical protein